MTHSTYRKQREGYLHMRNSSCMTSWDGSSLSALFQSPEHPALDQTPGEKAVKGELCSSSLAKEPILNTELKQAPRKILFPSLPCQTAEEGAVLLQSLGQSLLLSVGLWYTRNMQVMHRNKPKLTYCSPDTNPLLCSRGSFATSELGKSE